MTTKTKKQTAGNNLFLADVKHLFNKPLFKLATEMVNENEVGPEAAPGSSATIWPRTSRGTSRRSTRSAAASGITERRSPTDRHRGAARPPSHPTDAKDETMTATKTKAVRLTKTERALLEKAARKSHGTLYAMTW